MSQATITALARSILGDQGEPFSSQAIGDGLAQRFELPRENIDPGGLTVFIRHTNGTMSPALTLNTDFTLDSRSGVVTLLTGPLSEGDILLVTGTAYEDFGPTDMDLWVTTAFGLHTHNRFPPVVMASPATGQIVLPQVEEYLVALLAVIEALWAAATDAAKDIDVSTPEGVSIPRSQRYAQLLNQINNLEAEYQRHAQLLNVGLHAIDNFTLRRVSRTTNRLVPIYVPQEFDDRTYPPVRVYPPINQGLA